MSEQQQQQVSGSDILSSIFPDSPQHGLRVETALESLVQSDCVCFDVDSTVINEEGIDVLAEFLGKGEEVASLTKQAMEGGMKFQDALKLRLDLLQPSKQSIEQCLAQRPLQLTKGVTSFVETLHQYNKDVFLVSGGFRVMIEPVAREICVAKTNIYANTIFWDDQGNYVGFDSNEPTSADMGKPKALELIQAEHDYNCMVMIGDGATDAQAVPPGTSGTWPISLC
jgi:phosphoserine phosphatase